MGHLPAPTFSIVIPSYNRSALLVEAVDSALSQTFKDFEVIVVDDGSTDDTRQAMAVYGDRIRYIHQENGNMAAARNRGIAAARGEYVAFLDSDDLFEPECLQKVLEVFHKYPDCGAVFGAEREFTHKDDPPGRLLTKRTPGIYFDTAGLVSRDTGVGSGRPPVIRRCHLERLGGYNLVIGGAEDCEMWIRYSFDVTMMLLPEPYIRRRIHPGTRSTGRAKNARGWLHILAWLQAEHPEFVRQHPKAYYRTLSKQHIRLGRELLAQGGGDRRRVAEARSHLRQAIRAYPYSRRPYIYLVAALISPGAYAAWRRWEVRFAKLRSAPPAA